MNSSLQIFANYLTWVAPSLLLGAAMLYLARHNSRLRIVLYLALFVLLRDAMTPLHLWSFGSQGLFWMRVHPDPLFLTGFGVCCLAISLTLYFFDRENQPLFRWTRGSVLPAFAWGPAGAAMVVAPFLLLYGHVPLDSRGGPVDHSLLPAIFAFAMLGNLLEEALFRGYVLGALLQSMPPMKAGLWSGIVFAFCHIYLAATVTSVGCGLLLFTLWEGIIAGLAGARSGVIASTLTHGGAIFLLTSGLL